MLAVIKRWIPAFAGMTAAALLSGCIAQSKIQGRYMEAQSGCQEYAEENIGQYTAGKNLSPKDHNAELVTLFSDCMGKEGWQVAKPKRKKVAYVPGSGTDQAPLPTTASAAKAPAPQPVPRPVQTQSTALTPSGSMPPLSQPVSPGAAMYQPARPVPPSPISPYGTGPGRGF